jgi:Flp pilus assembly pilin Flp
MSGIMNFIRDNSGASAVEYSLLVGLIAGAIVLTVTGLGQTLASMWSNFMSHWPDTP